MPPCLHKTILAEGMFSIKIRAAVLLRITFHLQSYRGLWMGWLHHDNVTKWKHFPRNWSFVRGIHRSPVNSPHKGQWCGPFMFSLICAGINGWVNNHEAGDLRRHRAHYDVTVITVWFFFSLMTRTRETASIYFLCCSELNMLLNKLSSCRCRESPWRSCKGNVMNRHMCYIKFNYFIQQSGVGEVIRLKWNGYQIFQFCVNGFCPYKIIITWAFS